MKTDYAGLRNVAEAERKVAELGSSDALRRELAAREERLKRDSDYLTEAPKVLGRIINSDSEEGTPPTAARIANELKISDWQKRAQSTDVEESLAAKRVLNTLLAQTSFYLPQMLTQRKDYDNALLMLSVAAEIRPDSPGIWAEIAAAWARKGKSGRKQALDALDKAVGLGFTDRAQIDAETAFDGLRQDERFREILGKIPAGGSRG
jgi:tetratricopeptide (TPR) repeat protein